MDFLKELFALRALKEEDDVVQAGDLKVDDQVHQQLDDAAEDDDLDAQCFGLEMEDGKVVKVYVKQEDAEDFEKAMSEKLGETDDLKTAIEELEKDFEILKVVWPDEDQEDDDSEDGEDDEDGSESLNGAVDYSDEDDENAPDKFQKEAEVAPLSYGQAFAKKIMELKWSDEDSKEYSGAASKDEDDTGEEDPDAKDEPTEPQDATPKGIDAGWEVEKEEDGSMTISNKRFKVELNADETLELLNKIDGKQVARFKNEQGKIVYVFTPKGSDYVLQTPEYQGGFRIPKDIVQKILG